jgi:hypothetical protein
LENPLTTLDQGPAPIAVEAPRAAGSRARSRELGYAQAMLDMAVVLRDLETQYKAHAAKAPTPELAIGFLAGTAALDVAASYAVSSYMIFSDDRSGGIGGFLRFAWGNGGREAPKELDGGAR